MVKSINWTRERLDTLDEQQLQNLMTNAINANRQDLVLLCEEVISTRPSKTSRSRNPRSFPQKNGAKAFADEIAEQMGIFAKELAQRFDLSEETARLKSAGAKGFVAHALIDSRGRAKTGGAEKTKKLQFDRLLSYRLGDASVTLSVFLLPDDGLDKVRFQINAPSHFLSDGVPFESSGRIGLYKPRAGTERYRFKDYPSLEEALDAYAVLVQELQAAFGIKPLGAPRDVNGTVRSG
jgi:hypothetical protein